MSPLEIECPKCGALPGAKCRTLTTNRSTDTHTDRWAVIWRMQRIALRHYRTRHGLGPAEQ